MSKLKEWLLWVVDPEKRSRRWMWKEALGLLALVVGLVPLGIYMWDVATASDCEPAQLTSVQVDMLTADYMAAVRSLRETMGNKETGDPFLEIAKAFEEVLKLDPNFPGALVNQASAYFMGGDPERSELAYREAIKTISCVQEQVEGGRPAGDFASWLPAAEARHESMVTKDYLLQRLKSDIATAHYNLACLYGRPFGRRRNQPGVRAARATRSGLRELRRLTTSRV